MKTIFRSAIVATVALGATSALSDGVSEAMQCELVGEASDDDVIAAAGKWLAAARTMPGGEEMGLSIHFPVAGGRPGTDFALILSAPSFEAWGRFWDGYAESPAEAIDDAAKEITACESGGLYGSVKIEPAG